MSFPWASSFFFFFSFLSSRPILRRRLARTEAQRTIESYELVTFDAAARRRGKKINHHKIALFKGAFHKELQCRPDTA